MSVDNCDEINSTFFRFFPGFAFFLLNFQLLSVPDLLATLQRA